MKDCFASLAMTKKKNPSGTPCHLPLQERLERRHCERSDLVSVPVRHCEERSDEAIYNLHIKKDCRAPLAMTKKGHSLGLFKPPLVRGGVPQGRRG